MSKLADECIPTSVLFPPPSKVVCFSCIWMDESIATVFLTAYRIGLLRAKLMYERKAYTNVLTTDVSISGGRVGMACISNGDSTILIRYTTA